MPSHSPKSSTVLVVDDNKTSLKLLSAILESEDVSVITATNGQEALDTLDHQHIDLVISDILMPKLDGYQLCLEVRKRETLRSIPFIHFTSTFTSATDERTAYDMGSTLFLRKPEQLQEVVKAVRKIKQGEKIENPALKSVPAEADIMREYSEVLVSKLEKRAHELEERTADLEIANTQLTWLRWAFDCSSDGLIVTDLAGRIIMANSAFCHMFEYNLDEVLGCRTSFLRSKSSTPTFYREMWKILASEGRWHGEVLNRTKSGKEKECYVTITPILDDNNVRLGYLGLERDLTEQKQLQNEVAHHAQLAVIGESMSVLAHEIRNPLNGIQLNAHLLEEIPLGNQWTTEDAESVSLIKREIARLQALVESVLSFARKQELHFERVPLKDFMQEVISIEQGMATERQVLVRVNCALESLEVRCDANLIKQVLLNLLKNAIEAASERDGRREVLISCHIEDTADADRTRMITIEFYNTGQVLDHDTQQNFFKPFHTTKQNGSGLGLVTSLKIVHQHGGRLFVQSPPQKMPENSADFVTVFTVQLPE